MKLAPNSATTYLIHYGELGLKGKNRRDFEKKLSDNIKNSCKNCNISPTITTAHRYFTLTVEAQRSERTAEILKRTFGIRWFAEVKIIDRESTPEQIAKQISEYATPHADSEKSFKIAVKRSDKRYPQTSDALERSIGAKVIKNTPYHSVDLSSPDDIYYVEIDQKEIFFYGKRHEGAGGLPVSTGGRVLVLLSGGFDSPVAAYLMAKRGCSVNFLHFFVKEPQPESKIPNLAKALSDFTGPAKLHLAPYLPFNLAVLDIKTYYELVLFRRFMLRVGEQLCREYGYDALITGDSLGQVASQTIENISATNDALSETLCFRPLISHDKEDIISIAKKIGTYDISREPEKDCCSIIDRHAKTRVTIDKIREEEKKFEEYDVIMKKTLEETTVM